MRNAHHGLRSLFYRPCSARSRCLRDRRLRLEALEERCLLATRVWTGADAVNDLWSDEDNWDTGVPRDGDDVLIPATANSAEVVFDAQSRDRESLSTP
jgi:hypothetical protein